MRSSFLVCIGVLSLWACNTREPHLLPDVITEKTPNDTDDPAIWIHPDDPAKSIVFGTDKETTGGIYAFDLQGKIIPEMSITGVKRPNNVDLIQGFSLNDSTRIDVLVFAERERQQMRVYSVPDMKPLDQGGFPVFEDEANLENRLPMGLALYKSPQSGELYAIVGRKQGPSEGYLYQYHLTPSGTGVQAKLVRKFGHFSGKKEIEAIAVDSELGFVYYSDEMHCVRKYHADPAKGDEELTCFGQEYFKEDIEGIAIAKEENGAGYIVVSDQQRGHFNFFDRKSNAYIGALDLGTTETDGCDVVTLSLNDTFKGGLFVAMNDAKDFYFYDWGKMLDALNKK